MKDYVQFDHEIADVLVRDFFSRITSAATIKKCIPVPVLNKIMRGFVLKDWQKKGRDWSPFRRLSTELVKQPSLGLQLAGGLKHNFIVDPTQTLGTKRVEQAALKAGPINALWLTILSAEFNEKASRAGFETAVQLARTMRQDTDESDKQSIVETDSEHSPKTLDEKPPGTRSLAKENKRLKKDMQSLRAELEKAAHLADKQALKTERELTQQEKQLVDLAEQLNQARSSAAKDAGKAKKHIDELVDERQALLEEAHDLRAQLERMALPVPLPRPPEPAINSLKLSDHIDMIKQALTAAVRKVAGEVAIDTRRLTALIAAIESLDQLAGLELEAEDPVVAAQELAPLAANAYAGLPVYMDPEILRAMDKHNAETDVKRIEASIFGPAMPTRILIDAHNMLLNHGFDGAEAKGRAWLEAVVPHLVERTGAYVLVVFDTKHKEQTIHGANYQIIYAPKKSGGADARIREDLLIARDGLVLVVSDDNEVIENANNAGRESGNVKSVPCAMMAGHLKALEALYSIA